MEDLIKGRVFKVRKMSKHLLFIVLNSSGVFIEAVYEHPETVIKAGDYIIIQGQWRKKVSRNEKEFSINKLKFHQRPKQTKFLTETLNNRKTEAHFVRSVIEAKVHLYFWEEKYRLVNTPVLVGDWVLGQTKSFSVNSYSGSTSYLSISSILYHQIIQSQGYDKIYEVARLFRRDNSSSKKRLSEFSNVVISMVESDLSVLIKVFTKFIRFLHSQIVVLNLKYLDISKEINFAQIEYNELLAKSGISETTGHQIPKRVREYMDKTFESFVWVTNFPKNTRPFYVKTKNNICDDCQLWYKGKNYLATGGIIETEPSLIKKNIKQQEKIPEKFKFYTDALELGIPTIANIDIGLERLLGFWFKDGLTSEFAFFPNFKGNIV